MTKLLIRAFIKNHDNVSEPKVRASYGKLAGTVGICANIVLFLIKMIAGTLTGSVSVAADAFNNLADASSSIVSLLGFRMAEKPADPEHPYGHARYEYLSGLFVAVLILMIGVELLKTGINKILHPTAVAFGLLPIIILSVSIAVKLWLCFFNRRLGKTISSETLIATAADSRNDVIATAAVLAAMVIAHFFTINLDGVMCLLVALFILYSGIGILKDTISPLLGRAPDPALVQMIEEKVLAYPGVLGIHDLIIHDYGPGRQFATLHVEMAAEDDVLTSHDVIDNIERDFLANGLHLLVHFDPVVTSDAATGELRLWLSEEITHIHPELTLHDLRTVPGPTHTNVIFDLVIPHGYAAEEIAIKQRIRTAVAERYPNHFCVITVDQSFAPTKGH